MSLHTCMREQWRLDALPDTTTDLRGWQQKDSDPSFSCQSWSY